MRTLLALGVATMFLALPAAAQDAGIKNPTTSTPTTLYMHIDGIQDFPVNTQAPDDRYQKGESYGAATNTLSCLPAVAGAEGLTANTYHTWYGYSSPGYVEYDYAEVGADGQPQPRYHRERGLSYDVKIDTAGDASVTWYLESRTSTADGPQNDLPAMIPNVVVRAILRTGDAVTLGDEGFNQGTVFAEGQVKGDLLGPQTAGEGVSYMEDVNVYKFDIPLDFKTDGVIPRDESYNIRIDAYIEDPAESCSDPQYSTGDKYLMSNAVRAYTASNARPQINLHILNPIRIDFLHPMFVGDDLVIHSSMNSPWGNYDVAEDEGPWATAGGLLLEISGPSPATSLTRTNFTQRHHEHNHHQEPVDVTWIWPYQRDGAANGVYTVTLRVSNDAQNAWAEGVATFEIGTGTVVGCGDAAGDEENKDCNVEQHKDGNRAQESPGVGLVALVGLIGAAALALRRRS